MAKLRVIHPTGEQTLREALADTLQISRGRAKELLDARSVFVNGKRVWMAKHPVGPQDRIEVAQIEPDAADLEIPILWAQGAALVVNKPAGILSNGPDSVEERLQRSLRCKSLRAAHRLDRETSGCLLMVKDAATFAAVKTVFQAGTVVKEYAVLVVGSVPENVRVIDRPLDGKSALTRIEGRTVGTGATFLRVVIETGRTHQIRRHLAAIGHPVVGDREYLTTTLTDDRLKTVPRQFLHAARLALTIPGVPRIDVRAPLPQELAAALALFRIAA